MLVCRDARGRNAENAMRSMRHPHAVRSPMLAWTVIGTIVLLAGSLLRPALGAVPVRCDVRGTAAGDRLVGTARSEVICGKGGDDRLWGYRGPDKLLGAVGRDRLRGGVGEDTLGGGD